jgi:hypothetical protein
MLKHDRTPTRRGGGCREATFPTLTWCALARGLTFRFDEHNPLQYLRTNLTAQERAFFLFPRLWCGRPAAGRVGRAASLVRVRGRQRCETPGGEAEIIADEPEHVVVRVSAPARGFLYLADQYFPGRRATVNGAPVPILRANYVFRAVEVPAGTSTVEFRYRPVSVLAGVAITAITLAGLAILAFQSAGDASEARPADSQWDPRRRRWSPIRPGMAALNQRVAGSIPARPISKIRASCGEVRGSLRCWSQVDHNGGRLARRPALRAPS